MNISPKKKTLDLDFDAAKQRVTELLAEEGFGMLTHIDVRATLAKKLGVDFRRYEILGACNPGLAHRALEAEPDVGVLLPCNVALWEDDGRTVVSVFDPGQLGADSDDEALRSVAAEADEKLERVLARL